MTAEGAERATGRLTARAEGSLRVFHRQINLRTEEGLQFIDLTEEIVALVDCSGVRNGWVNVQTRHTTTAVIVNEHEPLLLEDLKRTLQRLVPQDDDYRHNDVEIRTSNMTPDESPNGHSHCQSLLLNCSVTLNILNGEIQCVRLIETPAQIEPEELRDAKRVGVSAGASTPDWMIKLVVERLRELGRQAQLIYAKIA